MSGNPTLRLPNCMKFYFLRMTVKLRKIYFQIQGCTIKDCPFRIEEICFLIKNDVSNNTDVVIAGVTGGFADPPP